MKPIARLFSVLAVFGILVPLLVACGTAPATPGAPAAATGATAAPASEAPAAGPRRLR